MPIYEYKCPKCNKVFEKLWKGYSFSEDCLPCPDCNEPSPRIISGCTFQFGLGFLETTGEIGDKVFFDGKRPSMRDKFKKEAGL